MEMIEIYFPSFNLKVGISVAAVLWMLALINGRNADIVLPPIKQSMACNMKMQLIKDDIMTSPTFITMATATNSDIKTQTINISCSNYFQVDWNDTDFQNLDLIIEEDNDTIVSTLFPQSGDPLTMRSGNGKLFLITGIPDENTTVCIHTLHSNTTVNVIKNKTIYDTYEMSSFELMCLPQNISSDGVVLNSTEDIQVFIGNREFLKSEEDMESDTCYVSTDNVWESLPAFDSSGTEYFVVIPDQNQDFFIILSGMEGGEINITTDANSTFITNNAFESLSINLKGMKYAIISSTNPLQIMCITWVPDRNGTMFKNLIFLIPTDQYTYCSWVSIQNCDIWPCVLALNMKPFGNITMKSAHTNESYHLIEKAGDMYSVWEIGNLSDGLYQLTVDNTESKVIVYTINQDKGWFMPGLKTSNKTCSENYVGGSNCFSIFTSKYDNTSTPSNNSVYQNQSDESSTIAGSTSDNSQNISSSSAVNPTTITTQTTTTTTTDVNTLSDNATVEWTTATVTNETDSLQQNSSGVQNSSSPGVYYNESQGNNQSHSNTVKIQNPNLVFLYEEVPEDDTLVREYMIAVIVSLCVAIFAVIAVIATFLFLELISRRKQIRNTKIRPFMS